VGLRELRGCTTEEIRREVPGWTIFTHGAPGGETADQVAARADRVIARAEAAGGVMRKIDVLATTTLEVSCEGKSKLVDASVVQEAIKRCGEALS